VYAPKSLYGIFDEVIWQDNYGGGEYFKDKVVLVGPAAPQLHDSHPTPAGFVHGAQLHLQSIGCLLSESFLHDAPW
jgi:adenylate cyclase